MRESLMELIKKGIDKHESTIENYVHPEWEFIADYLLANGVIVPPCKVGNQVYCVLEDFDVVMEGFVRQFLVTEEIFVDCVIRGYFNQVFHVSNFGKTVFLTREEAEAKLKGGATE